VVSFCDLILIYSLALPVYPVGLELHHSLEVRCTITVSGLCVVCYLKVASILCLI
jgi:hypothetical protein